MGKQSSSLPAHRAWIQLARLQSDEADRQAEHLELPTHDVGAPVLNADSFPGYDLEREIHRGAQGAVYRAVQKSTGRRVALKLLHDHVFGEPLERARFEREMHILAAVQHPNIVTIHDGGSHDGRVFLVMDYIAGQPLDVYMASQPRTIRETVELFIQICDAVNAAHVRGIIHRDLKPANVRVEPTGKPYVLDFGLAKFTTGAPTDKADIVVAATLTGQFLGSVPWSAPEQAEGSPTRIDIRTDVYSLGVLLYQILTGKFPYPVTAPMKDVLNTIVHRSPTRPRLIRREVDDELETIVLMCLSKERERRYQTAGELATDLRRYLVGEPIEAKRDSTWYVLRKTLRRHRRTVTVAAAFLLLVAIAVTALSILYVRQGLLLGEVASERDKSKAAEKRASDGFRQAENESYVANIAASAAALASNDGGVALRRLQSTPHALRNWEWHYLVGQADESVATWHGPGGFLTGRVRISQDNRYVGAVFWKEGQGNVVRVWPRTSGHGWPELTAAGASLEFSKGSEKLLVVEQPGVVSYRDLVDMQEVERIEYVMQSGESILDFSPDRRLILIGSEHGYRLWDLVHDRMLVQLDLTAKDESTTAAFDATSERLALGFRDGTISIWDVESGQETINTQVHDGIVYGIAFSPDGKLLATSGGENGDLRLWELPDRPTEPLNAIPNSPSRMRLIRELRDGVQRVALITFSPDGHFLAAPSEDKAVRIWSAYEYALVRKFLGHTTGVTCVNFDSSGRWLASGAREGVVKLWDLQNPPPHRVIQNLPGPIDSISFNLDGSLIALDAENTAIVVDTNTGRTLWERAIPAESTQGVLPGPGPSQITLSAADGTIHIWDVSTEKEIRTLKGHQSSPTLWADHSGDVLASADADTVILWNWSTGREIGRFAGPRKPLRRIALSFDASQIAFVTRDGEVSLLDAKSGQTNHIGGENGKFTKDVALSPDGRYLATGSEDQTATLWDVANGHVIWSAFLDVGDVWCVAFSPDGKRLAAGGRDRSVRLLDVNNGQELLALRGPRGTAMCLTFSRDGRSIAVGSWAREVYVWDATEAK